MSKKVKTVTDIKKSLYPIYLINRLGGVGVFESSNGSPYFKFTIFYQILIFSIQGFFIYYGANYGSAPPEGRDLNKSDWVFESMISFNLLSSVFAAIMSLLKYKVPKFLYNV